jgi:hypothetical protein
MGMMTSVDRKRKASCLGKGDSEGKTVGRRLVISKSEKASNLKKAGKLQDVVMTKGQAPAFSVK